ncbi:pectate lyase-like adhesive domain-containing protein [Enterococcus mundtii]|uniref:pectate lyase-like adhesive domain-containing protein n=1 Tax=Enterococcus mundtii TaxID=53346 RepID=UPI0035C6C1D8
MNGNGHHIDFGSVSLVPMGVTHNAQSPWDITFNDATIYSGNWWGFCQNRETLVGSATDIQNSVERCVCVGESNACTLLYPCRSVW